VTGSYGSRDVGALLETDVAMEEEMLGALLVADVHRKKKVCFRWQSHESY